MNYICRIAILLLFFTLSFFLPKTVFAQHACACTPTCSRSCTAPNCGGTCNNACALGSVEPLTYSGNGNLDINLDWADAANSTAYEVIVRNSSGTIVFQQSALTVSNATFTATSAESYTWTVRAYSWCRNGSAVAGPTIGVPSLGAVILAAGESGACTNTNCNSRDMIVGLDQNRNRIIPVSMSATDANGGANIEQLYLIFDNDNNYSNGYDLRVNYLRNTDGSYQVVRDANSRFPTIAVTNGNAVVNGNTVTVTFNLDLSGLTAEQFFLSNVYLNAFDTTNISPGRTLKVGAGSFTTAETNYPYGTNSLAALDIWNGRDVLVSNVGFYPVSQYQEVCNQVNLPGSLTGSLTASYSPNNSGNWLTSLPNWNNNTIIQPYYYFNNLNYQITYTPQTNAAIILTGMSAEQYGGSCVAASGNSVTNSFRNGGVRVQDSGVGDRSKTTAFAVIEVAKSWSQIYDGSLFSNSNFILGIEPITCPACVLMNTLNSENNGLLLINGSLDVKDNVSIGINQNWYAQTVSGNLPFKNFRLDKTYEEIKSMFSPNSFIELEGAQTVAASGSLNNITLNQTYFINGNLTVDSSTLLEVPEDDYLLFVVNGDLTITDAVKDSAAGVDNRAVEAMFVVFGDIVVEDDSNDYNDALTFEGSLVTTGNIHFGRSLYTNNNTRPPVKVYFRPDMLGKMAQDNVGIISLQKSLVSQY